MSEPNYRCESDRLYTFLHYPDDAICWPSQLSRMGFYSTGQGEEVRCSGCGVSHTNFPMGQSIRGEHMQRSPNCPLNVIGDNLQADGDIVLPQYFLPQAPPILQPNEDRPMDINNHVVRYYSRELQIYVTFTRSDPNFELLAAEGIRLRRRTFFDYPGIYSDREPLALHGFFYTGTLDKVQCCVCGIMYRARDLQDLLSSRQTVCNVSCGRYF
jgi:hypothetical protein